MAAILLAAMAFDAVQNLAHTSIHVSHDFVIPEPEQLPPLLPEDLVLETVPFASLWTAVPSPTIHLNGDFLPGKSEVENEGMTKGELGGEIDTQSQPPSP